MLRKRTNCFLNALQIIWHNCFGKYLPSRITCELLQRRSAKIDIFAGTGAVGIEALSRGADEVIFIEHHAPAATLIRKNLQTLGIRTGVKVLPMDALRGLQKVEDTTPKSAPRFDIVFLDPPYAATEDYARVLSFLSTARFLSEGSIVIAEHRRDFAFPEQLGNLERVRVLRRGDACLTFFRRHSANQS